MLQNYFTNAAAGQAEIEEMISEVSATFKASNKVVSLLYSMTPTNILKMILIFMHLVQFH